MKGEGVYAPEPHEQAPEPRRQLGQARGQGRAGYAHLQPQDEAKVQHDIQQRRDDQEDHRGAAVSQGPNDAGEKIIKDGDRNEGEDHHDVGVGLPYDIVRRAGDAQHGGTQAYRQHRDGQGEGGAQQRPVDHEAAHPGNIPSPKGLGHRDGKAAAYAHAEPQDQKVQRTGAAYRRQGVKPQRLAYDGRIHEVVKLLQQKAQHQGKENCKINRVGEP